MPAQASKTHPEEEGPMTSAQKRLSFAKPTDTLFFRQLGPISAVNDDPLSELLASAAQLDVPETLTPAGPTDDSDQAPQLGSAAIVFERKESRRMSMGVGDSIRRKQSSIAVSQNTIQIARFKSFILNWSTQNQYVVASVLYNYWIFCNVITGSVVML